MSDKKDMMFTVLDGTPEEQKIHREISWYAYRRRKRTVYVR